MPWIKQPPTLTKKQIDEIARQVNKFEKTIKGRVKRGYSKKIIINSK